MQEERENVYIVGYPKSGNTWLARLLGDVLDSPVISGKDKPSLADEGYARKGKYIIRQQHIIHKNRPNDGKIVFIVRDPRDVAVSVMYYWQKKNLMSVISGMSGRKGSGHNAPLSKSGGWIKFVSQWMEDCDFDVFVKYENMVKNTALCVRSMLCLLGADAVKPIDEVVERQSFANRKKSIHNQLPYGETIQRRLMRKGVVGDWKKHFECQHAELMHERFFEIMEDLEYESDENWWKRVCDN